MQEFDHIVLGGGVSALGFAKRLSENGQKVLILEKEDVIGGLSRTLQYKGFYLDFCAHRFHTRNAALLEEILALPGLQMHKHIKKSRIYMFGKYLKYPFELQNLLRAMPLKDSLSSAADFVFNKIRYAFKKPVKLESFRDWFVYRYGEKLYQVMCRPYTAKIWHTDPAELSADWADQRFKSEDLNKLIKRILKKLVTLDFSSYNIQDDSLAPDGGPFYYPLKGIQELPDALAKAAVLHGTEIICSAEITAINHNDRTVEYISDGERHTARYGELTSTIPLHEFYRLQNRRDGKVENALSHLKYMDIIFVFVFLNIERISNDHWLYFPDEEILFNRAVEFSNWSPEMCPGGQTSVCFDITTFGEGVARMSDEEIKNRTINDAVRIGYLKKEDIEDTMVFRVKNAYPYYPVDYKVHLDEIVHFFENDPHTHLLGRTGLFRYNNSDNSIEMGFELAEQFLNSENDISARKHRVRQVSY
jgi:protoporphyrinogen oxidase